MGNIITTAFLGLEVKISPLVFSVVCHHGDWHSMLKPNPVSGGISGEIFKIKEAREATEAVFASRYFEELESNAPVNRICYVPIVSYLFLSFFVYERCACRLNSNLIVEYILSNYWNICLTWHRFSHGRVHLTRPAEGRWTTWLQNGAVLPPSG